MCATTACDPRIPYAAAATAATKIDRDCIDLTRKAGLRVYLIDPCWRASVCGARLRRMARGASDAGGARPAAGPPCSRANCVGFTNTTYSLYLHIASDTTT